MTEGERARESPRERADPCLGRLLVFFWAHCIEDDPHLLCIGLFLVVSFTDNKGEDVTKYIKEGYLQCKGRNGQNSLCSILGRSSSEFRKLKILSKHLLPQFRVREF